MEKLLTFCDTDLEKLYRAQLQPYLFKFFTCEIVTLIALGLLFYFFGWDKEGRTQSTSIFIILLIPFYGLLWVYIYFRRSKLEFALVSLNLITLILQVWFSNPNQANIYLVYLQGGNIMMVMIIQVFTLEFRVFIFYNLILMLSRIFYGIYLGFELNIQQTANTIIFHLILNYCVYLKELKQRELFLLSLKNDQLEQAFGLLQNEPYAIFQFHQNSLEFKLKQMDLHQFVQYQEDQSDQQQELLQFHQFLRGAKVDNQTLEEIIFKQIKDLPLSELYKLKESHIWITFNKKNFEVKIVQMYQESLTFYLTILTKAHSRNAISHLKSKHNQFKAKYLGMLEKIAQKNLKLLLNKSNTLLTLNKLTMVSLEVLIYFKMTHMEDIEPKQIELGSFIKDILDKYSFDNLKIVNYQNSTIRSYPPLLCFYFLFIFTALKSKNPVYIKIINEINDNIQVIVSKDFKIKYSKPQIVLENYLIYDKRIVPYVSTTYVFSQEPKMSFNQNLYQDLKQFNKL